MALPDFPLAELTTLRDGTTVEWEAIGEGPPLVWVEGGPGLWAHLARPDVELVSDLFRCHLVNSPGCGRTSTPDTAAGYDLPEIIAFFERFREELGLGAVTVMGHSWGGLVAASWAAAHPESVHRLVVVDGYPGALSAQPAAEVEQARALARHEGAEWFPAAMQAFGDEEVVDLDEAGTIAVFDPAWPLYFADPGSALAAPHLARIRREVRWNVEMDHAWFRGPHHFDAIDILPAMSAVRCPTLVIAGEHDFICGPAWNRPIANSIRNARYVEIAAAGHLPQYEQPDAFRSALEDWLAAG